MLSLQMLSLVVLLILFQPGEGGTSPISCYNDQGEAVDWFYLYKLPHVDREIPNDGQSYLLMDKGSEGWTDGKVLVNDSTGALGRTVGRLYEQGKNEDIAYILYNDQRPPEEGERGFGQDNINLSVVLLDKTQGYWLVHSTPHFPPVKEIGQYFYPGSGVQNGQNFICVTYPLERFQAIGQMAYSNLPHTQPASNRSVSLTSLGGTKFISFAKGRSFNNDLYHSWVAPTLQSDLLVQFWIRSTGILPSDCSLGWKVLDIQLISPGGRITFKASNDHSKWAVSTTGGGVDRAAGWVCVGDINRNEAEEKRGGGTVCLQDATVWKAYRTAWFKHQ
uniref:Deoxyribonuclease-2-alpha n=1 Tax=Oncorhynchus tshawytscha TaxID=74940 RepID=A0A8C8FFQ7_ONCTS